MNKLNLLKKSIFCIATMVLIINSISAQIDVDFENGFPQNDWTAYQNFNDCGADVFWIDNVMNVVCTSFPAISGNGNFMTIDVDGDNPPNIVWRTDNINIFGNQNFSIDVVHRFASPGNPNVPAQPVQLALSDQNGMILANIQINLFTDWITISQGITIPNGTTSLMLVNQTGSCVNCDFAIDNISISFCPNPNDLFIHIQDENENCINTFCQGQDIWLDGTIPDPNHWKYFIGIGKYDNNNDIVDYCTPANDGLGTWFVGQLERLNLSEVVEQECGSFFENGYTYKIKLAYWDPCIEWVETTSIISIENHCLDYVITECSLDSYNIKNDCFKDAQITIENNGSLSPNNDGLILVWLSEDAQLDGADILLYYDNLEIINAGESVTLNFEIEFPHNELSKCNYYLFFESFLIGDTNSENNVCFRNVKNCTGPVGPGPIGPSGGPLSGLLGGGKVKADTPQKLSNTERSFTVYPNPSVDKINVNLTNVNPKDVFITDARGKTFTSVKVEHESIIQFDVSDYPSGLYIANTIDANGQIVSKRFIKK